MRHILLKNSQLFWRECDEANSSHVTGAGSRNQEPSILERGQMLLPRNVTFPAHSPIDRISRPFLRLIEG